METLQMSKMIEEFYPQLEEFILSLGYSDIQAKSFANGYINHLKTLPTLEKLRAIEYMHDPCMTAGFTEASINEQEALNKYNQM